MSKVEVQRCPVCGAPVARAARRCDYCSAQLSTVRCGGCFASNAAEALHCSGCGRELGLEPILAGENAFGCPDCRRPLATFAGVRGVLGECEGCAGQFVEHALLAELLERREVHRAALGPGSRKPPRRDNPLAKPVRYVPCPSCQAMMNRNNFGGTSGIVVDVCPRHGVWFDAGELPRVLAFVQAGGLELARAREEQERARHERERRVEVAWSRPTPLGRAGGALDHGTSLAGAVLELVALVAGALKPD